MFPDNTSLNNCVVTPILFIARETNIESQAHVAQLQDAELMCDTAA